MTPTALLADESELAQFLDEVPSDAALAVRTLAHAWLGGGGRIAVGKVAIRLVGGPGTGFSAGAIHADPPRLEFCRVILQRNGLGEEQWMHWSDECADLGQRGFDPGARFPSVGLTGVDPAGLARLATALRDLARLVA